VTCRDVEAQLMRYASGAAVPPEAAIHIGGCEPCRRLVQAVRESRSIAPPSADEVKKIEAGILADLRPVKPMAPAGLRSSELMLILLVVAAVGVEALGIAGWRALSLLQRGVVFPALAIAASLLAYSLGRLMAPGSRLPLPRYWLVPVAFGTVASIFASLFRPHREATFVATGLVCLRIGLEYAAPAALLSWLLLRRGAILNPLQTGAATGAFAGLTGLTVLEIFCPNLNQYHILVWHLGAALTSAAGGMVIGSIAEYSGWRRVHRN
jgi:hypothetical protein